MYEIINNVHLKIKEYKGQRVVTFKDIDMVHGRPDGTAGRNFRANRDYFIEGEDYFTLELTNDEIRRQFGVGKNAGKTLILLTESGYLMIVKSLTDKLSWSVQKDLIRTYFRARQMETFYNDAILKKLDKLEREISYIRNDVLSVRRDLMVADDRSEKNINKAVETSVSEIIKVLAPFMQLPKVISTKNKIKRQPRNYSNGKIENFPPAIKSKVDEMIISGKYSCQKITEFITRITGESISYMTVSRYMKKYFKN